MIPFLTFIIEVKALNMVRVDVDWLKLVETKINPEVTTCSLQGSS